MKKKFICIICPNGCEIEAEFDEKGIQNLEGNLCDKGAEYVKKEIFSPERGLATSVRVESGSLPLVSVKTSKPIPKGRIMDVMKEVGKLKVPAPVKVGDILLEDILGTGADLVATKNVERK